MKQLQGSGVIFAGATVVLLAAQPTWAQSTAQVTAVQLKPTERGFDIVLKTSTGKSPQIFMSQQGNTLVADIVNTQLRLPQGNSFRQDNPAPGIAAVLIAQFQPNSVRMLVSGITSPPNSQIGQRDAKGITLNISPGSANPATPAASSQPAQTPVAPRPDVLVPNPKITIDGVPVPAGTTPAATPPFLPRAIAPPVGDIAVSNTDSAPSAIDLGSNERVPRLVLRDAPVREVLALLARAAGLNLAFTAAGAGGQGQPDQATAAAPEGPRISLDIENETVQNVFNYVLQLSGLQANRRGNTIFVGARLSNQARDVLVRSMRLNQVTVGVALNFLVGMGAESAVSRERTVTSVNAVPVGGNATPVTQTQTSTETRIETQRIDFQDSIPLLRGLQVLGDERTNSVTLIGTPKQIDVATAQLVQLDARRRQVAVNVKIVDVNLAATDNLNTSFSFAVGDSFFRSVSGTFSGFFGRGGGNPTTNGDVNGNRQFLAQLQASVQNGSGKILTDPTLTVQEGQTAVVNLTQQVFAGLRLQTSSIGDGNAAVSNQEPIIKDAGLILQVRIDRIDDNGFVALSVAPTVSAVGSTQFIQGQGDIALLQTRQLSTGQVRLRDGQTLILSGIIQESDRVSVNKVPILGDIPLLGALFRNTSRSNSRQEVIVLLTPQIIDDSERSSVGYNYSPGPEVRQMLERRGSQVPGNNP